MYFNKTFSSINSTETPKNINRRTAVRAIIIEGEKILLVRSNLGYYKLPGGGVEEGESHAMALIREVAEETGFLNCNVGEKLGITLEQRPDNSAANSCFQMESHHFQCELGDKKMASQALLGYELEEGYKPVWVPLQNAIDTNESLYETDKSLVFIPRENYVLKLLKEFILAEKPY